MLAFDLKYIRKLSQSMLQIHWNEAKLYSPHLGCMHQSMFTRKKCNLTN